MDDIERTTAPVVPGYRVDRVVGRGGQSVVWAGTRQVDGVEHALKVLPVDAAEAAEAVRRAVRSDDLVTVHDVVALPDGGCAVVMDLMVGGSLRGLVGARGGLTAGECVTVLTPLAEALGRLHALGIVHGDVSPDNVLLDANGRPRLSDLGAAHVRGGGPRDVLGTDGFVAPEVVLGSSPTPSADVYGAAALGVFALSGTEPVAFGTLPPTPASAAALRTVLDAALTSDPRARPTADALAVAVFGTASPEPLLLVSEQDPTSGITRRLRAAMESGDASTPPQESRGQRRRAGGRSSLLGVRRTALTRGAGPHRRGERARIGRAGEGTRAGRSVALTLGRLVPVLLALTLLTLAGGAWRSMAGEQSRDAGKVTSQESTLRVGEPAAPEAVADTTKDLRDDQVGALVQRVAERRAAAWTTPSAPAFAALSVPDSPAAASDREDAGQVLDAGRRATGLSMTARDVHLVRREAVDRIVVRAAVDVSSHVLTGPDGSRNVAAGTGEPLDFELRWYDGRWRVWEVRPPT